MNKYLQLIHKLFFTPRGFSEEAKLTNLFTHDIQEAIKLGTTIILLNNGKIEQVGTREDLIYNPASNFVKEFFGVKGFQATLDKNVMNDVYEKLLSKEECIETLYERLKS